MTALKEMSQNPEVKLARNTELDFTEAHLTDLKPESCIVAYTALFCCVLPGDCRAASHGLFLSRVSIMTRDRNEFCLSVTFRYWMKTA